MANIRKQTDEQGFTPITIVKDGRNYEAKIKKEVTFDGLVQFTIKCYSIIVRSEKSYDPTEALNDATNKLCKKL